METRDRERAVRPPAGLALVAIAVTAAFWILGVAAPLAAIGARLGGEGVAALVDPDVLGVAWATARQAGMSTLISVAVGLPLGLAVARVSGRAASALDSLLGLPQGVPTVVAATAWVAWLGRSGWLARLDLGYSLSAVIVAHVFFNAPWVALLVAQARRAVPRAPLEAASTLGAGAWARFGLIAWPSLRWSLGAAAAQVMAACSMSFALVMILGGGPPVETLETALYARIRGGALDLAGAAACAAWEVALTLTPWILVLVARSRARGGTASAAPVVAPRRGLGSGLLLAATFFFVSVFFVPYLAVFSGADASLLLSGAFWADVARPLSLSLVIAACAGLGALALASLAILAVSCSPMRWRALLEGALSLPSGLSVLVLGLGAWLAYGRFIDPFEGSLLAIVGLQIVVFFPVAHRILWPVAQAGQRARMEAAWALGASPWRAFWSVDWPRWRAPAASALALVGAMALGEVAAVSLFYSESLVPLPLVVSRWMGQYRFEEARAASLLLLAGAVGLMAASVLGKGRVRAHGG
jgi:thiamine transport system permease protein